MGVLMAECVVVTVAVAVVDLVAVAVAVAVGWVVAEGLTRVEATWPPRRRWSPHCWETAGVVMCKVCVVMSWGLCE